MAGRAPCILVVDDDAPSRRVLRLMLEDDGYQVITAASLAEARRLLTDGPPDLIVCDLLMPATPTFALLDLLQSDQRWRHLPVVLCTAAIMELEQAGGRLDPAHIVVVHKPFEIGELLGVVVRLLGRAE